MLGAAAATLVTALSAVAGWCVARRQAGSRLLDGLAALPLVFPAIVLGLAFLEIFVHAGSRAELIQYALKNSIVNDPKVDNCSMAEH